MPVSPMLLPELFTAEDAEKKKGRSWESGKKNTVYRVLGIVQSLLLLPSQCLVFFSAFSAVNNPG